MMDTHTVYSDEPADKEEGSVPEAPCTTPDIIVRERKPSSYRKRRTIYTAGMLQWVVLCAGDLMTSLLFNAMGHEISYSTSNLI